MDELKVIICLPPDSFICGTTVCSRNRIHETSQLICANRVPVIFGLQPSSNTLDPNSIQFCRALIGFQGVASLLLTLAVQAILLLRGPWYLFFSKFQTTNILFLVEALFQKQLRLQLILRTLYIGEIVATTVVISIAMPDIQYGAHCVVTYIPIKLSTTCL